MIQPESKPLADIAESVRYGYTASATREPVGPHFLRITDIVPLQIDWDSVPYCTIDEKNLERYRLQPGDIVVARTGATVGYAKLIRDERDAVFASYLVRFRFDSSEVEPGYIGRVLESDMYKRFVLSRVGGAAQPNANAKVLSAFPLPLPPLDTQKRIASILSAYDDLIENNRRRIQLLGQSARLLFKEWFVHLRFPGHEHAKIKDGIPEKWEKKTLGEVVPLKYGKTLKQDDRIPGPYPVFGSSGVVGFHNKALVQGPGIIVGRKGNVGSVYWSATDYHPIDTVYFIDSENCNFYLFYALLNTAFISTDVAVPGLNRNFAHSRTFLMPEQKILRLFEEFVTPLHGQINNLRKYNDSLKKARDILLPRLMNGEVTL
ncbi:restriction endonuclease subunit S [Desulfobacterales bacterium HSG2]|nr:restriction endonuclease subunit S [Desulfobacterales bacterium HSG2]